MFSSGYATISSAIPAFAKRGDLLICDKGISHALQTGVLLSRSNTFWFKHNDVEDLERVLIEVEKHQIAKHMNMDRPPVRKFLVLEGLYPNYGDIAVRRCSCVLLLLLTPCSEQPLARFLELRKRHCFRVILDDSFGMGVLGTTGRGTFEHQGLDASAIDILTGSMANALGSVGGYCAGKREMVYHQRLNAAGYVFSASSPPYLLVATSAAMNM